MLESSHVAGPQMRAYVDTATPCPPSPRTTLVLGSRNSFSRQQIRGGARRPAPERSRARRTSLGRTHILRDKRHCRCSYPHAPQCRPTLAFPLPHPAPGLSGRIAGSDRESIRMRWPQSHRFGSQSSTGSRAGQAVRAWDTAPPWDTAPHGIPRRRGIPRRKGCRVAWSADDESASLVVGSPVVGSPVPVQMWAELAQSWCRCGRSWPSPGADVGGASPVLVQRWGG